MFGCQLPQETGDFEKLAKIAEECERLGYDSVSAYDHLAPYWNQRGQAFECWTLLAAIAQRTEEIKVGSLVTNVNLRNPALLAKITSSVDNLSKGRLIVGLGTGDSMSRNELLSYGYSFAGIDERVERLKETVLILKAMWTQDQTSFEGKYSRLSNAVIIPSPYRPHIRRYGSVESIRRFLILLLRWPTVGTTGGLRGRCWRSAANTFLTSVSEWVGILSRSPNHGREYCHMSQNRTDLPTK